MAKASTSGHGVIGVAVGVGLGAVVAPTIVDLISRWRLRREGYTPLELEGIKEADHAAWDIKARLIGAGVLGLLGGLIASRID